MQQLARLEPPDAQAGQPLDVVLDTDTYNEIDDQFALVYALLSPERIRLHAVYAAPFQNRTTTPEAGMRRSYDEIVRILGLFGRDPAGLAFEGSTRWLTGAGAVPSAAASDLIDRAGGHDAADPLYVVAIGAPTNVASALLTAPDLAEQIVVVWLGGNPTTWHTAAEFNLEQDPDASRVLFDSGVPLVHVPCLNVTEHLRTTLAEIDWFVRPCGALGGYLAGIYEAYYTDHFGRSKVLWDIGAIAYLIDPGWTPSALVHSPILTADLTWSHDPRRHLVRELLTVDRDAIFGDLFRKLGAYRDSA
ncbi:MAG TPA: nucleoside hydrolase [Actinophytocola sp.]|uniref:nucleoside hydrolase n=1 Tax=Actinophytocola sp. TaxID=1872138 RepID=UPI002DDD389A|nr:nucleoside hydrolase [Actinophytocola sp.]HEV2781247.1 nucleoside hydrolase [Actinophytocola sp.]